MPGEATLTTGHATFWPPSWAVTPDAALISVNGLDRGLRYDGMTAATEGLGITAPTVAPSALTPGGGAATAGDYLIAYRYLDDQGFPSSLSAVTTVTAASNDQFDWTITSSGESRVTQVELYRSKVGETDVLYRVTTLTAGTTTYTDQLSDTSLSANASLPIQNPDGSLFARQFTPAPTDRSVVLPYQDRALYFVTVTYDAGTVAVTNGSATVTGTGTAWTSQMAGRYFAKVGDTRNYLISSVNVGAQTLALSVNYAGSTTSGSSYAIEPDPLLKNEILYSSIYDPTDKTGFEAVSTLNSIIVPANFAEDDKLTGGWVQNGDCYVGMGRHLFQLSFEKQPLIDHFVHLVAYRGLLNQRTWCIAEGVAYVLDQQGIYAWPGPNPISDPIQDLFRDGTISWTNSKWFFAQACPERHTVYFGVQFTGDTGTRPKNLLAYNYKLNAWWVETFNWELGGVCSLEISGRIRHLLGAEDDIVYLRHQGTIDGLDSTTESGTLRGTVTSSTNTTFSDSGATFPTDVATNNTPVYILDGTGKYQERRVTTRNSGTQLTVDSAWTTNPDTTSVYQIGGIYARMQFGLFKVSRKKNKQDGGEAEQDVQQGVGVVFSPTTGNALLHIRHYANHETTAANHQVTRAVGGPGSTKQSDPDFKVDLKRTRSAQANEPGYCEELWGAVLAAESRQSLWMSPELRGVQGADAMTVLGMYLLGMERG